MLLFYNLTTVPIIVFFIFVLFQEYVPQNDASEIISKCARKNFEVEGHDMLEAKWLPELNVIECQELCKKIEGCQYFVSRIGSNQICQLKSGSAVKQWQDESISPHSYTYSGPAECDDLQPNDGKGMIFVKFKGGLCIIFYSFLNHLIINYRLLFSFSFSTMYSLFSNKCRHCRSLYEH